MKLLLETKEYLLSKGISNPEIGIVLGTGLSKILDAAEITITIPYADIPNFPISTVEFHKGNLVYGKLGGKSVLIFQGRFHQYEGYEMQQIIYPVRIMKILGVKALLLSNAAGGINSSYKKGDLVLLTDHINLQSGNPLTGKNMEEIGDRFPDMSMPYNEQLGVYLKTNSAKLNIQLKEGIYAAVNGPNLETRAEYRYLKIIGADMVGMSTVPEVIAANHAQLPCAAISVITDECDPDNLKPVNIAEIMEVAGKADEKLAIVFAATVSAINLNEL